MQVKKFKIVQSAQGNRTPKRTQACKECGEVMTNYRLELFVPCQISDLRISLTGLERIRVCPQCVLTAFISQQSFWGRLKAVFSKPVKINIEEIKIKKGGASSKIKCQTFPETNTL